MLITTVKLTMAASDDVILFTFDKPAAHAGFPAPDIYLEPIDFFIYEKLMTLTEVGSMLDSSVPFIVIVI